MIINLLFSFSTFSVPFKILIGLIIVRRKYIVLALETSDKIFLYSLAKNLGGGDRLD